MNENYTPDRIDTSGVDVSSSLHRQLIRYVARNAHNDWLRGCVEEAKASGMTKAQLQERYPAAKPWKELTDAEKASPLAKAAEAVKVVEMRFGVADAVDGLGGATRRMVVDAVAANAGGDTSYGEYVWSGIRTLGERKREREEFCAGLNLDPESAEGKALFRFRDKVLKMTPDELLAVIDRAKGDFGKTEDVSRFDGLRQEVLDMRAEFQKDFIEHRGEPGFARTQKEQDESVKEVMRANDLDVFDLPKLGRRGVAMLRNAYVGILREKGVDQKLVASVSPEDAKRMRAREAYSRFASASGEELKGPKIR
jgi:hypothetical protein